MTAPVVATAGSDDPDAPLVVLLHGRGSHEREILTLSGHLPPELSYAAVRAPIPEGSGFAWFANRGIGRPVAASLRTTMDWFRAWLDTAATPGRPVILVRSDLPVFRSWWRRVSTTTSFRANCSTVPGRTWWGSPER